MDFHRRSCLVQLKRLIQSNVATEQLERFDYVICTLGRESLYVTNRVRVTNLFKQLLLRAEERFC